MRTRSIDRILVGSALATALISFAGVGAMRHDQRYPAVRPESVAAYLSASLAVPTAKAVKWQPPRAQTRGPGWVYDVFTPPEISYDEHTREFTVALPKDSRGADDAAPPRGPVLLAIKREPFRLQLIGYVGGDGTYRGAFENLNTAEVIFGGIGREMAALNLVITDFSLRRPLVRTVGGMTSSPWIATAVVRDQRSGADITLREGERTWTNELRAVLAEDPEEEDSVVELRAGEEFQSSDQTYRIDRLQLEPPQAELTRISSATSQSLHLNLTASGDADAGASRLSFIDDDD